MSKNMLEDIKPISRAPRTVSAPVSSARTAKPIVPKEVPFTPKTPTHSSKHALWYIAAACVIGFFFSISFLFEKATVTITPKSIPVVFDATDTFTAFKDSLQSEDIVYTAMSLSGDQSMTLPSTEQKKITEKAVGTVVLYNTQSATGYAIAKGTRLQATNNQIYRTNQAVTIPGYTKVNGTLVPGSIEVGVISDVASEQANIQMTDFSLPGLAGLPQAKKIYGRSKGAITGGFSGTVYIVSTDSADVAVATLSEKLKQSLLAKAKVQIPDGYLFFDTATEFTADDNAQVLYSKESDVPVSIHGTLTAYLIKEDTLAKAITKKFVSQYQGEAVVVENLGAMKLVTTQNINEKTDTSFVFSLDSSTYITWQIKDTSIQTVLAGKKKSDFQSILSGVVGITKAEVVIKPFWKQSFPEDVERIAVGFKPAHE